MKKQTKKQYLFKPFLLFILGIILLSLPSGCQADFEDSLESNPETVHFKTRIVSLDEISKGQNEIKNFIEAANAESLNSNKTIAGAKFDDKNIMESSDIDGNINYSTKYNYVNDPENIFYNLVVNVLPNGQKTTYILKYICNPEAFQKFKLSNYNFNYFVGVTEMKNYVDPTTQVGVAAKSNGDCEPILIPSPTTNGSSGNSGSNPSTSVPIGATTTSLNYLVSGSSSGVTSVSWGNNVSYSGGGTSTNAGGSSCHDGCISMGGGQFIYQFGPVKKPHLHKNGNPINKDYDPDCIENTVPVGPVPVNNIITAAQELRTILNLTKQQSLFLFARQNIAVDLNKFVFNNFTDQGKAFALEVLNSAISEPNQEDVNALVNLTLKIEENNDKLFEDNFITSLDPYVDLDLANPPSTFNPYSLGLKVFVDYVKVRKLNPEWSRGKCLWEASKGIVHLSLDVFGTIPVGGEIADLVNGVLYTIEGDGLNAGISYTSAAPVLGWAAVSTRYAIKIKTAYGINNQVKLVWKVLPDGTIYFGTNSTCRAQLRKALGMIVGDGLQAHHIIPLNLQNNPIVQKAFKAAEAFHLNEALNGIPLSTAIHNGSHGAYDAKIIEKLIDFNRLNPNATPSQCYHAVTDIISDIRTAIANNPNVPINKLRF